jgi:hypothetical protein
MRGIFWNSNGFKDPKRHKSVSDLTKEIVLNLSPYPKRVGMISCRDFSKTFVEEEIISGIVKLIGVGLGACSLVWTSKCLILGPIDEGDYYIKFHLCNKVDEFKWVSVVVYGPA